MGGYFGFNKVMDGQKDYFDDIKQEYKKYFEALRKEIIQKKLVIDGSMHDKNYVPVFSDGKVGHFTYRGWGDLMAAIWTDKLKENFSYMDFYVFTDEGKHIKKLIKEQL